MSDLTPIIDVQVTNAVKELKKQYEESPINEKIKLFYLDDNIDELICITIASYGIWAYDNIVHNKKIWLDDSTSLSRVKKYGLEDFELPTLEFKSVFLKNYTSIQEMLTDKINDIIKEKENGMLEVASIIDELSRPLPAPPTEEQTVNIIDFGYRTIEIITNDHLVLVDNRNLTTKKGAYSTENVMSKLMLQLLREDKEKRKG